MTDIGMIGGIEASSLMGMAALESPGVDSSGVMDPEFAAIIGPARLAYSTPVHEPGLMADRKAAFLLTACGMLLTTLIFFLPMLVASRAARPLIGSCLLAITGMLAGLIIVSAVSAYRGFVAPLPEMPQSLMHYRTVGRCELDDYLKRIHGLTHAEALGEVLAYNHVVARQSANKFRWVNHSLRLFHVVIPTWMALLLAIAVLGW